MGSHLSKTLQDLPRQPPHLDSCSSPPCPLLWPHHLPVISWTYQLYSHPWAFASALPSAWKGLPQDGSMIFFFGCLPLVLVNSGSFGAAPRLSSCGGWAQCCGEGGVGGLSCPLTCEILVPTPGIEPMSPALQGRFLTTGGHQESPDSLMIHSFASLRSLLKCNLLREAMP